MHSWAMHTQILVAESLLDTCRQTQIISVQSDQQDKMKHKRNSNSDCEPITDNDARLSQKQIARAIYFSDISRQT